jgi:hypothetical protein
MPIPCVGGCLCGALQFESSAEPVDSGYCHCRLCQRSTGAPVLAYVSFPVASFRYIAGAPAIYPSSERGAREFCAKCGTQIAFRASVNTTTVDVNVGALDRAGDFPPRKHIYCASAVPWLTLYDKLPRYDEGVPIGP